MPRTLDSQRAPLTILLAEDDADDVLMMQKALEAAGFDGRIVVVGDGEQVLAQVRREMPDLLLLDLNMPRMSGLEALKEIKGDATLQMLPVLVFTTSGSAYDALQCYAAGANSFIVKPALFSEFTKVVAAVCRYWLHCVRLPTRLD